MPTSGRSWIERSLISLYFHIPFCKKKCGYCHFYVIPDKEQFKQMLMQGLRKEWDLRQPLLEGKEIISLYFGGGTPALLGPEKIGEIISWVDELPAEVTLEANPEFIDEAMMREYANVGVNRVSMGVQSLDDKLLKRLTREHNTAQACVAVEAAVRAGIRNISIDLMYDVPGQTGASWRETLERATSLPITHLSLYNLTIEPHTVFFKRRATIEKEVPGEEASLEMYKNAVEVLGKAGLTQYEISAFAREGYHSRHNVGYWTARPFLGFGPSAFSYWDGIRFRNVANINRYCNILKEGSAPIDFEEKLADSARRRELLAIQIRLLDGVHRDEFEQRHGKLDGDAWSAVARLVDEGYISYEENTLRLTEKGILFYDTVGMELIE